MTNAKIVLSQITHFNWAKPFHASMGKVDAWQKACAMFLICAATAIASPAQTFNTLVSFNGPNRDAFPAFGSLVEGTDGNLYGTTDNGGSPSSSCNLVEGCGTVFKITPEGTLTTLYSFCSQTNCSDGKEPYVGMVLGTDGNFYGTTSQGGAGCTPRGCGTVFKITPEGTLTTLYTFCSQTGCADGRLPAGALVLGTDGNFYGTTDGGGVHGAGTVFNITPEGTLTTLHSFERNNGAGPLGALALGTDGNFYGTTAGGGTGSDCLQKNCGTVFKITPEGTFRTLYNFCSQTNCADGSSPYGNLIQATDGNFYGTTAGTTPLNEAYVGGTVFKITPQGALTTLYSFCAQAGCPDGAYPYAGVIQATDGNFYGTTSGGGANNVGTLFSITMEGALTTLYTFAEQVQPYGQMVQATNGILYGTTNLGGANNGGMVYSLSMAFVTLDPDSGEIGQIVDILGQGFTGTTAVSFNGTPASFTVVSGTYLTATVPSGATTGLVTVTAPSGTVDSNQPFRVTPQITSFNPTSGPVGTTVTITGASLTQTTKVAFGGVNATFTVNSDTQVTATVPTGAITGHIVITTAGGKAASPTIFHVDS